MNFFQRIYDVYIKGEEKNKPQIINEFFSTSLTSNIAFFKSYFEKTADFSVRMIECIGISGAIISVDGMVNKENLATNVIYPITIAKLKYATAEEKFNYLRDEIISYSDQLEISSFETAFQLITSGFALIAMDGCDKMLAVGVQGFSFRSVAEPTSEVMQRGSREGFVEPVRINMTMIRRRLRNPNLRFDVMNAGNISKTEIVVCYLNDKVSPTILEKVKKNILKIDLETVLESGYVIPYLEDKHDFSLFSSVGMTERPDTVCGKIAEGRVAILIDGTPTALIVPYLFVEYFQHLDDYSMRPFFATFTRWLKYLAFFTSILLPGLYVAISTFNPEILPGQLLNKIALAVGTTPFTIMTETIIIHLFYEIMREAGLRIPRPLSHAVSIVGALVIGETAVSAGLIGAPTLMVVALTAISSYVIPNLYEPISILKFVFIIAGGLLGIWGIMIIFAAVLVNICSKDAYGVPFTSPIAPFNIFAMRDVLMRVSWKALGKKVVNIQDYIGSKEREI